MTRWRENETAIFETAHDNIKVHAHAMTLMVALAYATHTRKAIAHALALCDVCAMGCSMCSAGIVFQTRQTPSETGRDRGAKREEE